MRWLIAVVMLAGCDAVFLPDKNAVDPSRLRFGEPEPVPGINTLAEEDRPTLTDDLLELYFQRMTSLYVAKRSSVEAPFGTAARVDELGGIVRRGCISGDGLRLYFSRNVATNPTNFDLFLATRASRAEAWTETPLSDLTAELPGGNEFCGSEALGDTLMLATDFFGDADLVRWRPDDTTEPIDRITALNTGDNEGPAWASRDERILVFERAQGDVHIVQATLEGAQYVTRVLDELDIDGQAGSPWLSQDGRLIVYSKDNDIYMATR